MPDRYIRSLDGKRGSFLLICGFFWSLLGTTYLAYSSPGREAGFHWLPLNITPRDGGWLWIVVGVGVMLAALSSKSHPQVERLAFSALSIPPALWVAIYYLSAVIGANPPGLITAITYAAYLCLVLFVSSWPNPPKHRPLRGGDQLP